MNFFIYDSKFYPQPNAQILQANTMAFSLVAVHGINDTEWTTEEWTTTQVGKQAQTGLGTWLYKRLDVVLRLRHSLANT